jgi:hypothetical protein
MMEARRRGLLKVDDIFEGGDVSIVALAGKEGGCSVLSNSGSP